MVIVPKLLSGIVGKSFALSTQADSCASLTNVVRVSKQNIDQTTQAASCATPAMVSCVSTRNIASTKAYQIIEPAKKRGRKRFKIISGNFLKITYA